MIKRTLYPLLHAHLHKPEITLIIGPRQAGKSTLMKLLQKDLEKRRHKTLFLNLDIERDKVFFASQQALLDKIRLEFGDKRGYVFIDEIQRKQDAGVFLKGLYDMSLPYKFIVTGSGSLELKEKIHESLAGRKQVFELFPLSFTEFVNYVTQYKYENRLSEYFSVESKQIVSFLNQYLNFGGYPRVVLAETLEEKQAAIEEIYKSYLEKDIGYLNITKTESYGLLLKILASQIGQLVNISELSSTLGLSIQTVKHYLWFAEKTFIIKKMTPFFRNIRKEIIKSPVYYFTDLGMRNFATNQFGSIQYLQTGFLFQNFIYLYLITNVIKGNTSLHFWRTVNGGEVDFVIDRKNDQIPIEVKSMEMKKSTGTKSALSYIQKYRPRLFYIINLSLFETKKIRSTKVIWLPFWRMAEILKRRGRH